MRDEVLIKLKQITIEKFSYDIDGKRVNTTGTITYDEAIFMYRLIVDKKLFYTVETGVAYGASTLAICAALEKLNNNGNEVKHWGLDPCQKTDFNYSVISTLKSLHLEKIFELLEAPSHLGLPQIILLKTKLDFAFIDGWHTFDYTLVDFFLIDQMLKPGGYLCVHDLNMPSKRKVLKYIKTHRKYQIINELNRPLKRRILSFGKLLLEGKISFAFLTLITIRPMLILKKTEDFQPPYDFYSNF